MKWHKRVRTVVMPNRSRLHSPQHHPHVIPCGSPVQALQKGVVAIDYCVLDWGFGGSDRLCSFFFTAKAVMRLQRTIPGLWLPPLLLASIGVIMHNEIDISENKWHGSSCDSCWFYNRATSMLLPLSQKDPTRAPYPTRMHVSRCNSNTAS